MKKQNPVRFAPLTTFPHIVHGGDYNPDQWLSSPDILQQDISLMHKAHINSATVAIFAWSALEPEEGVYSFGWLDETLDRLYENGIRTVLATPSGARPAWLDRNHPEAMRVSNMGVRNHHGVRHNHCYTSPYYRAKVAEIDGKLAERYGRHPGVILWHLSNEYGGECYCDLCRAAFRDFLREKYGDIDTLNQQWWNAFWSHTFRSFDEIEPPLPNGETSTHGLNLDWKRFVTRQTTAFMKNEIAAIRQYSDLPVTTNLMGLYPGLDYRVLARELDLVSWDSYPRWHAYGVGDDVTAVQTAFAHDLMRCVHPSKKPFFLMESTPSVVNWMDVNKLKRPGMHALSSIHAIAHGADSVQYFQFRKSRGACEKLHGAVVDHAGHAQTRVFREVSELGETLGKLDELVGTATVSRVALLYDWDNRWAIEDLRGLNKRRRYPETCQEHYRYFCEAGINVDIIGRDDPFDGYDLLIAPMMYMAPDGMGEKMRRFTESGGTLVATYLTGYVNENDLCHLGGWPGVGLDELFGIRCEEIDALYEPERVEAAYCEENVLRLQGSFQAQDLCELIHCTTAEPVAVYRSEFYAGMPLITHRRAGKGHVYYIAARTGEEQLHAFYEALARQTGIVAPLGNLPAGVHAAVRSDGLQDYIFVMNFCSDAVTVPSTRAYTDLCTKETAGEDGFTLKPYGYVILKRKHHDGDSGGSSAG